MWEKIRVVFTIPELRQKILLTLMFLAIYRVGYHVPLPIINQEVMKVTGESQGMMDFFDRVAVFSASNLRQATIFGLGIMPYISASIILQLLGSVWKPLEELKKEGETGRKKINEYTRYLTVVLCLFQSWMYVKMYLMARPASGENGLIDQAFLNSSGVLSLGWEWTAVMTMTCGTVFLMWLGEQIDEFGIGNGISLLIMAGIVTRLPEAILYVGKNAERQLVGFTPGRMGVETILILIALFIAVVAGTVFITQGQRRIPTQSAKHVRGRRVYGGNRQFLPLRINQAGVMPIVFASSLLMLPAMFLGVLINGISWSTGSKWPEWLSEVSNMFHRGTSLTYNLLYVAFIYFFCYFWTAISFNPKEMSENLKDYGTFIPGYRPGRRTADYLEKVMVRITYVGAGFLAAIAIVPTVINVSLVPDYNVASFYGGTGLLIAVSVAFDLVQKIDSHLVMRNYRGLLES